jgi:hypothetical protein
MPDAPLKESGPSPFSKEQAAGLKSKHHRKIDSRTI